MLTIAPTDQISAGGPQCIPSHDSGLRQYGFVIMRYRSSYSSEAVRLLDSKILFSIPAKYIPTPKSMILIDIEFTNRSNTKFSGFKSVVI
jgi:hypothetical protein